MLKKAKLLSGFTDRYSMEVNGPWRLTFTCSDASTGVVTMIDLENYHVPGEPSATRCNGSHFKPAVLAFDAGFGSQ